MKTKAEKLIEELKALISDLQKSTGGFEQQEKQKQLQAVNNSIQQLQRISVAIPDEIRNLKSKLVNELAGSDQAELVLQFLSEELVQLTKTLGVVANKKNTSIKSGPRATGPKTNSSVLRDYIIKAIKSFGGRASMNDVMQWMEERLKDRLTPRDYSKRKTGEIVWRNNTQWERHQMIQEGILKSDSPRGIWELSEEYR